MIMESFWTWFPESAAWLLVFVGLVAITWVGYERKRKGGMVRGNREDWKEPVTVSKVLKVLSYFGILVGVLVLWAAFDGLMNDIAPSFAFRDNPANGEVPNGANYFTSVVLIILGLVCILKPLADVPWASLVGFIAGIALGILVLSYIPVDFLQYHFGWDPTWVYIIVFIIFGTIVGLMFKFWIGGITALSKFFSYPIVALILAIFCFVQGFMLLYLGTSLIAW